MPNRIIREAILSSQHVCRLTWPEEVFYRRLMSVVDDYGRCEAMPELLRARCYPLQTDLVRVADITRWMAACQMAGLIVYYELEGKQYLQIERFGQQIRAKSKCPAPPASDSTCHHVLASDSLVVFGVVDDTPLPPKGENASIRNGTGIRHADDTWEEDITAALQCQNATDEEIAWVLHEDQQRRYPDKPAAYWLRALHTRRSKQLRNAGTSVTASAKMPDATSQPDYQRFKERARQSE